MYLCKFFFTSIKSDGFLLCCAILKKEEKNSGFIAATLHFKGLSEDGGGGRIFLKTFRDSLFNEDLSNEPNFGRIHLAG